MSLIGFLSKYDKFLYDHLQFCKLNRNANTYLSNTIQNEILDYVGFSLKEKLKRDILTSKYYTIIIDSTPDISKLDQYALVLRYVKILDSENIEVKEANYASLQLMERTQKVFAVVF